MNRREFLKRMALLGLALPSTRTIVDLAANTWRQQQPKPTGYTVLYYELVEGTSEYRQIVMPVTTEHLTFAFNTPTSFFLNDQRIVPLATP